MSLWGRSRRAGSLLLLATLAAAVVAAAAPAIGTAPGTAGAKPPVRRTSPTLPKGRPLADTVLAVVANRRTIGVDAFQRGWTQVTPPARPDSLTPEAARRFLDLLIDKELLAIEAIQETWEWTALESIQVANMRDRTMMRVALDSAIAVAGRARAARGEPPIALEDLGVAARESTVAHLGVSYEDALLARLAKSWAALPRPSADSSLWSRLRTVGQMPSVDRADSGRVVAWSEVGTYKVTEMLDAWRKLNPLFRPRIETVEQVRDLVENGLFERVLRRDAELRHLERHPRVAEALERQREYLAVQHFVDREVYATLPSDSVTLRRYFDRDPGLWSVPTRIAVVRLLMPSRDEGARMAVRLRDAAEAETLVARGLHQGVDYGAQITQAADSALFAKALRSGTGTVLGPDSVSGGWQVVRVNAVISPHARSFEDVRELVLRAWSNEESERRLQALLAGLRKRARVVVNEPGIARLVKVGIPGRPSGRGS